MSLNKQQMFDDGVRHIIKQGRPAFRRIGPGAANIVCLYRASDGCKCLIGGLIPDELYRRGLDGGSGMNASMALRYIGFTGYGFGPGISDGDGDFINKLQRTHDGAAVNEQWHPGTFLHEFVDRARHFAKVMGLNTEALDAALAEKGGAQ